jgi:hypothetical protein
MHGNIVPINPSQVVISLDDLAIRIRDAHASVVSAFASAIDNAIEAGRSLIAAKKQAPRGRWGEFLERCDVGERQSQRYMKLAKLVEANPTLKSDLADYSIEQAIKKLSPPKLPRKSVLSNRTEHSKPAEPTSARTGHADIVAAWINAAASERTRALGGIGPAAWLEAMPSTWWPLIKQVIAERQKPPAITVNVNAIPDDLSVPAFLRRAPVRELESEEDLTP